MKTIRYFILTGILILAASFSGPMATISWDFTEHDFGEIAKNNPVTVDFTFNNPGMVPLFIEEVKSSCGCTVPNYSKEPIPPGGSGKITVTYDAKISGYFSKTVTVIANTEEKISLLYIKGEVK